MAVHRLVRASVLVASLAFVAAPSPIALAEVEENHHFDSLSGLVAGADVAFLGTVRSVSARDMGEGDSCRYIDVDVEVESVLSHRRGVVPGKRALFVDFECGPGVADLSAQYADSRAVFFGRVSDFPIPSGPDWHWIPIILAGHVHDHGGKAHIPETHNAPFLARLEGSSFSAFVRQVRGIAAGLPSTGTTAATVAPSRGEASSLALGLAALAVGLFLSWRMSALRRANGRVE